MKIRNPRNRLTLVVISGFLLVFSGIVISEGGLVHTILGGTIALGAIFILFGLAIDMLRQVR